MEASLTITQSLTPLLLTLLLLIPAQSAHAFQTRSGALQLSNTLGNGNTAYTVQYSFPSTADVGTNLTVTLTLHVDSLTGLIEYLYAYRLVVDVFVGPNELNGSVSSGSGVGAGNLLGSSHLYAGSSWGPSNVTIPLTAANTGLAQGASTNSTVIITLEDSIYEGYDSSEPSTQGAAGSLVIQNPAAAAGQTDYQTQTYFLYAGLAFGAALMISAVLLPRRAWRAQTDQKR